MDVSEKLNFIDRQIYKKAKKENDTVAVELYEKLANTNDNKEKKKILKQLLDRSNENLMDSFDSLTKSISEEDAKQAGQFLFESIFGDQLIKHERFKTAMATEEYRRDELKNKSLDAKTDIIKKQAEINLMNAKTEAEMGKSALIMKAVNNFDDLPQSLQVYVMRAVFNPGDKQEDDILLQEQVRDYLKMEKEAAAEKSRHEARRMKAQADVEEATADDSIRKMKKQQ